MHTGTGSGEAMANGAASCEELGQRGRVYMKQWPLCLIPALAIHRLEPRQLLEWIERRVPDLASRQHVRMELLIYLFTQVHGCRGGPARRMLGWL